MLVKGVNGGRVRVGATSGMLMGRRTSGQGARPGRGPGEAFRTAVGDVPNSSQACTREGKGTEGFSSLLPRLGFAGVSSFQFPSSRGPGFAGSPPEFQVSKSFPNVISEPTSVRAKVV